MALKTEEPRKINLVIVHCSDSPDTMDIGLPEIEKWHSERFSGVIVDGHRIHCGYHYIVRRDGTVEVGRPESVIGAHCEGYNSRSIGICWVGRQKPGEKQMAMLLGLVRNVMLRYGMASKQVRGHKEFNPNKTCPNLDMELFRRQLSVTTGMG